MVRQVDLKTIKHYNLTWNCKCNERTDVSEKQAIIECTHLPKKTLDYIELVPADLKSELDMLFEPVISRVNRMDEKLEQLSNIFDEDDE
jgi:hypothetical protein